MVKYIQPATRLYCVSPVFCLQRIWLKDQDKLQAFWIFESIRKKNKCLLWAQTEKAMAPHSSTFAWKIPWMEEPGGLQSMGLLESDTTEWLPFHFSLSCFGEGNGNPLQCSCLENPRDGGACWAAVYGVAQSRTRLKWLSNSSSSMSTKVAFAFAFSQLNEMVFLKVSFEKTSVC